MPITIGRSKYDYQPDTSFLSGYASLARLAKSRYDPSDYYQYTSPSRVGTIRGGASTAHLTEMIQPEKYTVIEPVKNLSTPVLGGGRNRTGNFTLDQIDWINNIEQLTGSTINKDPSVGSSSWGEEGFQGTPIDPQLDYLAGRDIAMENGPRRLMDYAFSPMSILFPGIGGQPSSTAARQAYPFQENPYYWNWLLESTPEQRKQQARIIADSRVDRSRNEPLYEMLLTQFNLDFDTYDYKSSGNKRIDYLAKMAVQVNPWVEGYVNPGMVGQAQVGPLTLRPQYGMGSVMGFGSPLAQVVPWVGTEVAEALDPITPETEARWLALKPEERKKLLDGFGLAAMGGDLVVGLGATVGLIKAANFLGSAQRVEAFTRAYTSADYARKIGLGSQWITGRAATGIKAVNAMMGVGLVNMTAAWAMQSYFPIDSPLAEAGRRMDGSRIISNSALAAQLNEAGFWAGFFGIDWLAPRALRMTMAGASKTHLFGGVPDLAFHRAYGGTDVAKILDRDYGILRTEQGTGLSAEFTSGLVQSRRAKLADVREQIEAGMPTGFGWIDNFENVDDRIAAWERSMAEGDHHIIAEINAQIALINSRVMRMRGNLGEKISRAIDGQVTDYMLKRYGATSRLWGPQVADMRAATQRFLGALGAKTTSLNAITRWAGKDPEKWGQVTRRTYQLLFHRRNVELRTAVEDAGEDVSRFAVFSMRTLFADEVEDAARVLTDADPLIGKNEMMRLVEGKDDIERWFNVGEFKTPEELADLLLQVQPVLPTRRIPAEGGNQLDAFQIALDNEGLWTIGFKPVGRFAGPMPESWINLQRIAENVPDAARKAITPDELLAMGYRRPFESEMMPGPEFRSRDPIWPIAEYGGGVWIKALPGDSAAASATRASQWAYGRAPRGMNQTTNLYRLGNTDEWFFNTPDPYDLNAVIEPGTQKLDWTPGVSQQFHGRESLVFRPGEGDVLSGEWMHWGGHNTDVAPQRTLDEMQHDWRSQWINEPDPGTITKAGVLVFERAPDGTVGFWAIQPVDKVTGKPWLGYDLTWPKGNADPGESLIDAAARELREETGMDASLYGFLGDFSDEQGTMVRFYLAVRESGGPDFALTPDEIGSMEFVNPAHVRDRLTKNGMHTFRDVAAWDAAVQKLSLRDWTGGDPLVMHGRNYGADWPVLEDWNGDRWLFKAQRGKPIEDLTTHRRLAGPTANKMFSYLGLTTGRNAPFIYNGIRGTIQRLFHVDHEIKLDAPSLLFYQSQAAHGAPDVVGELERQHVVDWFTSQHDSNSDAFLMTGGGEVAGIDKDQAWKFFGSDHEAKAFNDPNGKGFWTYGVNDPDFPNPENIGGDTHLGDYLYRFWAQGGLLDRGKVEEIVAKIEGIPDDTLRAWLGDLAYARQTRGLGSADEFIEMMLERKRTLRTVVNRAYEHVGGIAIKAPGEVQTFKPGAMGKMNLGTAEQLNGRLIATTINPSLTIPPITQMGGGGYFRVGLVIEEADGRLWVASDPNRVAERYFPRSGNLVGMDDHQQLVELARLAEEEFGLSVRIEEVIGDVPGANEITRYYRATRVGGGPVYAANKGQTILLGDKRQMMMDPRTAEMTVGWDAVKMLEDARAPKVADATAPVPEVAPATLPEEPKNEYVSYTVLPSGSTYRSPWLDYPLLHADEVLMGNRAMLSAKLDDVFRGWRTTRILEMQKGALYRSLDSLSPSFTPMRVQAFHERLLELARSEHFAGVQPLGMADKWGDFPGMRKLAEEVNELAEEIFGRGPYLGRDGTAVSVDWSREIRTAYRTAFRLNLTAGLTSYLKATGAGVRFALISDVMYPAFRFGLSPFFKAGEWAEAPILNGMRGTNPFGMDEAARALWERGGLPMSGAEYAENALADPMLASAGLGRQKAARQGWLTAPPPRGYMAQSEFRRNPPVPTAAGSAPRSTPLMDHLFPADRAHTYPDLPEHHADLLIPHTQDPTTGEWMLDPVKMRELDEARLEEVVSDHLQGMLHDITDPASDAADDLALGIGYLESVFTPDEIHRLALEVPLVHSIGHSSYRDMDRIERWVRDGMEPLASPAGHGASNLQARGTASGEAGFVATRNSTSDREQIFAHTNAPFAGSGVWASGIQFVLRNDRMMPRAIITNRDRMMIFDRHDASAAEALEKHILSANGAVAVAEATIRAKIIGSVKGRLFGYGTPPQLTTTVAEGFHSMSPLEYAWPDGGNWDDIAAIVLDEADHVRRWNNLVATHGDDIPALRDIEVIDVSGSGTTSGIMSQLWLRAFERAGLADKAGFTFDPAMVAEGRIPKIYPEEAIVPETVQKMADEIDKELARWGVSDSPVIYRTLEDWITAQIGSQRNRITQLGHKATVAPGQPANSRPGAAKANWEAEKRGWEASARETEERIVQYRQLLADIETWRASSPIRDYEQALDIITDPASTDEMKAAADAWQTTWHEMRLRATNIDRMQRLSTDMTSGPDTYSVIPGMHDLPERNVTLPKATEEQYVAAESTYYTREQRVEVVKAKNALLNELRATRVAPFESPGFLPQNQRNRITANVASTQFLNELQRVASLKTGTFQPVPQVKVWLRGSIESVRTAKEAGDVVITVSYPDGTFPLSLEEIGDIWKRHGSPAAQHNWDGGARPVEDDILHDAGYLWSQEGGPNGSLILDSGTFRVAGRYGAPPVGQFVQDPVGNWVFQMDPTVIPDSAARPVRFLYGFADEGAQASWNLSDDIRRVGTEIQHTRNRDAVPGQSGYGYTLEGSEFRFVAAGSTRVRWAYGFTEHPAYVSIKPQQALSRAGLEEALRDAKATFGDKAVQLDIMAPNDLLVIARLKALNELPDNWIVSRTGTSWPDSLGSSWRKALTPDEIDAFMPRRPRPEPPPDSLAEVEGSAEAVTAAFERGWKERIAAATGAHKARLKAGWESYWNPVPYKQRQQDRLIRDLTKDWFPDVLEAHAPKVLEVYQKQIGVPRDEIVDFLLEDRALLDRWIASGSADDFAALMAHADKYGIAKGDTRQELDSLYESPQWAVVSEMLHWTAKAARDESFGVHFFNSYRSTFERSINHPLLGIYPASWAYKVAKEWFRFLYMNETLGFHIGMKPAKVIYDIQKAQSQAFARDEGEELGPWLDNGPLGSTIFIFNLLMPGDWSGIPFPLSRSIRDGLRGNLSPSDHLKNNLVSIGLGRDVRLATEVADEWFTLATNEIKPRRQRERLAEDVFRR